MLNVLWPTLVCLLIIASCVTQIIACFRRDSVSWCLSFNYMYIKTNYALHVNMPLSPPSLSQIPIKRKEITGMSTISRRGHHFFTEPSTNNITVLYDIQCELHILTTFVIPDILLFLSFAYGLYIFRWKQTEQLSTLTETVGHPLGQSLSRTWNTYISLVTCNFSPLYCMLQ